MFQLVARRLEELRLPVDRWVGVGVVAAFCWLLVAGRIPPAVVYVLELYLTL